jgi:hypothetical protein
MQGRRERVRRKHGARPPITPSGSCARGLAPARTYRWARLGTGSVGNRIRPSQGGGSFCFLASRDTSALYYACLRPYSPNLVEGGFSEVREAPVPYGGRSRTGR